MFLLRGLIMKALVIGLTFSAVKYGPVGYEKYVGPLPPEIKEAQKYTDGEFIKKTFANISKSMPN